MSNSTCYPKTALKHYMAGWTDADESSVIEAHISACDICEQTLAELEGDPETLLEFLQGHVSTQQAQEKAQEKAANSLNDPLLSYALSKAKQIGIHRVADDNEPAATLSTLPTTLGPYDLLRPIGQGSMGRVYLARHRQLGKLVAIKVFAAKAFRSDQYALRFEREVRAAGALQHPSIINATDAGQAEAGQAEAGSAAGGQADILHYLVMEYIEGLDLSRLARAVGPLKIADVCAIGQAMALGLDHAHAAGIVHRDIKPSNVMLSTSGQVKLLDFGLAQTTMWDEVSAELTTVGQLMGTIDYMAPEQAERAESVDYRADLYALGATLFRLLCGRAPLAASPNLSPLARLRLLATTSPPTLRTLRPDAPIELERLIHQLLSRSPETRPASAAHVAQQLAVLADGADLTTLIQAAQQASPEPAPEPATRKSAFPAQPQPAFSNRPPIRMTRWLMSAAAGALALAATVLITLETQKGQVVIESLDANVTVQLSKDGQVQRSLSVVPGANSTRIAAGQYDVSIAAGSDQFTLDRDTFEIKRGETVIARVRQVPKIQANALATGSDQESSSIAVDGNAKVYEGKTLATWRKELMRDRSLEAINRALSAIAALADDQERSSILEEFLLNLPVHSGNHFDLLKKVLEVARDNQIYTQCIVKVLSKVDDDQATRLLEWAPHLFRMSARTGGKSDWIADIAPLAQWSADFLESENNRTEPATPGRRQLQLTAGFCVVTYLNMLSNTSPLQVEREQSLVETLKSSKVLDEQFWMRVIAPYEGSMSNTLAAAVEERATTCFLTSSNREFVVLATLQLSRLNSSKHDRTGMPPLKRRADLVEKIRERLREFTEHPERTTQNVEIERELVLLNAPPPISSRLMRLPPKIHTSNSGTNPCMDLLQLTANLGANEELAQELTGLLDKFKNPLFRFAGQFIGVRNSNNDIQWPALRTSVTAHASDLSLSDSLVPTQISTAEFMAAFIFSQIEEMLPKENRVALIWDLQQGAKQAWLDNQMKTYDLDGDGKLNSTELPRQTGIDTDNDQAVSRDELQTFYEGTLRRLEVYGDRPRGGGFQK